MMMECMCMCIQETPVIGILGTPGSLLGLKGAGAGVDRMSRLNRVPRAVHPTSAFPLSWPQKHWKKMSERIDSRNRRTELEDGKKGIKG